MTSVKPDILDRVNQIVHNLFEVEPPALRAEANLFTDLGLDSLDAIDLIVAFQKEFNIRPPNQELQGIRTMADVYDLVARYHAQLSPTP